MKLFKSIIKVGSFYYRLAQQVTELLDTFKPGTFSYQPFKKPMRSISIIDNNNNSENGENVTQPNTGRPRPFYRRSSLTFLRENTEILHQNPKSLMV